MRDQGEEWIGCLPCVCGFVGVYECLCVYSPSVFECTINIDHMWMIPLSVCTNLVAEEGEGRSRKDGSYGVCVWCVCVLSFIHIGRCRRIERLSSGEDEVHDI